MKKSLTLSLLLIVALFFISCESSKKKKEKNITEKVYSINTKTTKINWIAYKTTEKIPVKGQFTKFNIENVQKATSVKEALNGLKFSIPTSSLFTKDTVRDSKLKKFFFGVMKNTQLISGTISIYDKNSGTVDLIMNGISQKLPITYTFNDLMVKIEATMNLDNWQAQVALETLNTACEKLHTGPDGITKTWNEVKIEVISSLTYK